ncbi:hypothetical protein BCR34DRAFT_597794 [Clohesyomyces aquaticus]|uniref:Uncharacterized protein n=1 Tax=Clohesyomyces aquaticus TaxID=1231657 RepID=A0A1Y2A168_9PLEO|nr:hypothetical protein BCR34DRAFT_597794 [Clohesyomyces aquaticus]
MSSEEILLETICFDLSIETPYKTMYEMLKYCGMEHNKRLRNASRAFLHDPCLTELCLSGGGSRSPSGSPPSQWRRFSKTPPASSSQLIYTELGTPTYTGSPSELQRTTNVAAQMRPRPTSLPLTGEGSPGVKRSNAMSKAFTQFEKAAILVSIFLVSFAFALGKAILVPSLVPLATTAFYYHYQLAAINVTGEYEQCVIDSTAYFI